MSKTPLISVLMPVYNAEKFVGEAIESVLKQTCADFEFIIVNDGSTDGSLKIIKSFEDPRIVYVDNGRNRGLAASFNIGIDKAQGKYIARMDADDVCLKERFEKQLSLLEKKPQIGIVGSSIIIVDENGRKMAVHYRPRTHKAVKFGSLFSTPMYHPTVMGRSEIFKSHHFNETFSNSEDYELWSRLLFQTDVKFANITEPLLKYRVYPQSFTQTLNLDKRALSAHNTIINIERYIQLSEKERNFIIRRRQEFLLSPQEIIIGLLLYIRILVKFIRVERPGLREIYGMILKYLGFAFSIAKHEARKIIRRT